MDRKFALAALALSAGLAALGTSIANVGLPALSEAFDAPFHRVQWVVLAYLLAVTAMVVGAGRLGDLLGRKRLLAAGIGLFTLASLLCAFAPTLALLVAARAAQGLGAALMMALSLALVADVVPKGRTGSAMGLLGASSAVGTALGPALGGAAIAWVGWPGMFLVSLPLGLAALVLTSRCLPSDAPRSDRLPVRSRSASPLGDRGTSRDPIVVRGLAMSALVMAVMMATLVVGPFHLATALGLGAASVGLAMSAGPAVAALAGVPAGRLADRFGARRTTLSGLAAMAAACGLLAFLPTGSGVGGYVGPLVVMTAGYALFQTSNNMAVMAAAPAERRGAVSGMLNLSRNLGLLTGASLMGSLFALGTGSADIAAAAPEAVAQGTRITFAAALLLILAALALARGGASASAPAGRGPWSPRGRRC